MDLDKLISQEIKNHIASVSELEKTCAHDIRRAAEAIVAAYKNGNKVLLLGNGGSAADAQHIAADLVGRLSKDRRAFAAIALSANTSNLTAISNDYGFDQVFERQVEALAGKGDIVIGISTSGKSKNVINALRRARELGSTCIGLTGMDECPLDHLEHTIVIHAPSHQVTRIQEMHILIGHILCLAIEDQLA